MYLYYIIDESGNASGQNEEAGGHDEQASSPMETSVNPPTFPSTQDLFGNDSS